MRPGIINIWVFPKMVVPETGWFITENPIEIHDLGGPPLFLETPQKPRTHKHLKIDGV